MLEGLLRGGFAAAVKQVGTGDEIAGRRELIDHIHRERAETLAMER